MIQFGQKTIEYLDMSILYLALELLPDMKLLDYLARVIPDVLLLRISDLLA